MALRAGMAEWQTRRSQTPLAERSCGFESHSRYHRPHASVRDSPSGVRSASSDTPSGRRHERRAREAISTLAESNGKSDPLLTGPPVGAEPQRPRRPARGADEGQAPHVRRPVHERLRFGRTRSPARLLDRASVPWARTDHPSPAHPSTHDAAREQGAGVVRPGDQPCRGRDARALRRARHVAQLPVLVPSRAAAAAPDRPIAHDGAGARAACSDRRDRPAPLSRRPLVRAPQRQLRTRRAGQG